MNEREQQAAARLATQAAATARRHHFMDLQDKFTKYACLAQTIACGWVNAHDGQRLYADEAIAEKRVLAAAAAIAQAEAAETFDVVKLAKKGTK